MRPTPSPLALVTGTSSGIGAALARQLLAREWRVIGMSRTPGDIRSPGFEHVEVDLADTDTLIATLDQRIRPMLVDPSVSRVALVNNAADVALLGQMATVNPGPMLRAYAVNTVSPVLLMGWLLRSTHQRLPLRIVNVSSGAAVEPVPGMGCYSATKAALRIAGMVLAAELDLEADTTGQDRDVAIWSYEPGIVDTPMQALVRDTAPEQLPIVGIFRQLAENGQLTDAEIPAAAIVRFAESDHPPRFSEQRFELRS